MTLYTHVCDRCRRRIAIDRVQRIKVCGPVLPNVTYDGKTGNLVIDLCLDFT